MTFERIDLRGPELPERRQPGVELLEAFGFQAVEPALGVHAGFDEPRLAQHAQVLRDSRLRHAQLALDLAH